MGGRSRVLPRESRPTECPRCAGRRQSGEAIVAACAQRALCRQARGWRLDRLIETLRPIIRGWIAYFQLSEGKVAFVRLDEWRRRRLRCILWRQWKRPLTRQRRLMALGLDPDRAHRSAYNGRGPWWNAGASHMNQAIPLAWLRRRGLMSSLDQYQRLKHTS